MKITQKTPKSALTLVLAVVFILSACADQETDRSQVKINELEKQNTSLVLQLAVANTKVEALKGQIEQLDLGLKASNDRINILFTQCISPSSDFDVAKSLKELMDSVKAQCENTQKKIVDVYNSSVEDIKRENNTPEKSDDCSAGSSECNDLNNPQPTPAPSDPFDSGPNPGQNMTGSITNEDGGRSSEDLNRTAMMMGVFIACQYYSAGTCTMIASMVGINLGMTPEEVRGEANNLPADLREQAKNSTFEFPVGGRLIKLKVRDVKEIKEVVDEYNRMPEKDKNDICKVLDMLSTNKIWKNLAIASPIRPKFSSIADKSNWVASIRAVSPTISNVLARVPVQGEATQPITCN